MDPGDQSILSSPLPPAPGAPCRFSLEHVNDVGKLGQALPAAPVLWRVEPKMDHSYPDPGVARILAYLDLAFLFGLYSERRTGYALPEFMGVQM